MLDRGILHLGYKIDRNNWCTYYLFIYFKQAATGLKRAHLKALLKALGKKFLPVTHFSMLTDLCIIELHEVFSVELGSLEIYLGIITEWSTLHLDITSYNHKIICNDCWACDIPVCRVQKGSLIVSSLETALISICGFCWLQWSETTSWFQN